MEQYHPEWQPKYVIEDGERRGPFMYSTKWTLVEEQAQLLFGDDQGDSWKKVLEKEAYNPAYRAPDNHIHLATHVITYLNDKNKELLKKLIEVNKELSKLKRKTNT
jgi:hypothetical protein